MTRQKLYKYDLVSNDPWVLGGLESQHVLFPDAKNIVIEVACGRGEYSVGLADATKSGKSIYQDDTLFVGVDQKGDRISGGVQRARALGLETVRFVRGIVHHIGFWFAPHSVDEIWIVHPDPRPRDRDAKRRLTHPRFLSLYKNILKPGGLIRLKTDDRALFDYSVEMFEAVGWTKQSSTHSLHDDADLLQEHHGIQTHYEKLALDEGRKICYGVWQCPNPL